MARIMRSEKHEYQGPVDWALGRVLLENAVKPLVDFLLADRVDPRDWMSANELNCEDDSFGSTAAAGDIEELWFDMVADTGDSDVGAYSLGYLMHGDLTIREPELIRAATPNAACGLDVLVPKQGEAVALPRGQFLYVGGDTAYPVADSGLIRERFTKPMNHALMQRFLGQKMPPPRPLLGIPGNHDWYDSIDGFNRTFRKLPELKLDPLISSTEPTTPEGYLALQEASYFALKLPGGWGLWAIDARDGDDVDHRQRCFFAAATLPTKLLLATPNPAFVNGFPAKWYETFWDGRRLPSGARARLQLWFSGDTHHYARYPQLNLGGPPFTSLVSGLGGAALHAPLPGGRVAACKTHPPIEEGERAVLQRLLWPPFMFKHWGLAGLGAVLGLLLGAGVAQSEGEATFLIHAAVPTLGLGQPKTPLLLPIMFVTLCLAGLLFWLKRKARASREHDVRQMSRTRRVAGASWPLLLLFAAVVSLAHCRQASFASMMSDLGFHLALLVLLAAFPFLYALNVAEARRTVASYAASAFLAFALGVIVIVGSVGAAYLLRPCGFLGPPAAAALLQFFTFASLAGVIFAIGFKRGTHRMASSSFAAVDQYLAFIRFRLRVNKQTNESTLTGFVISVTEPVPLDALNGVDSKSSLGPKAQLLDVFTVG